MAMMIYHMYDTFLQEIEILEKHTDVNYTSLWPVFAGDSILVRREEIAFPFSSLLADCGGILGLFVGFNFLMIWGWGLNFLMFWFNRISKFKILKQIFK